MTLDPATLQHAARLLADAGQHEGSALLVRLLAEALPSVAPERQPAPAAVAEVPQTRQTPTAGTLRRAFFAIWSRVFGRAPKGGEALDSKVRRVAVLRQWWGIESARDFTDAHAAGERGVAWLSSLAQDPQELNYAIHAAIKADLQRPTVAELEATLGA